MKDRGTVVHSDPEILGGTPVFIGTRVPLAVAPLEAAHEALTARARPAR